LNTKQKELSSTRIVFFYKNKNYWSKLFSLVSFFLFILILPTQSIGQKINPNFTLVDSLIDNGKFDVAIIEISDILNSQMTFKDWDNIYKCQKYLCKIGGGSGSFESVVDTIEHYHQLIPSENILSGKSSLILGYIYVELGLSKIGANYYKYCIDKFTGTKEFYSLSTAYKNIGIYYMKNNDFNSAIKSTKAGIEILKISDPKNKLTNYISQLSDAYRYNHQFNLAHKTIELYKENIEHYTQKYFYQKAEIFLGQEKLDSSLKYIKLLEESGYLNAIKEDEFYTLKAKLLIKSGQYDEAIELLKKNEDSYLSLSDYREVGKYYLIFVDAYRRKQDWDNVYDYLTKGWNTFSQNTIKINEYRKVIDHKYLFHELYISEILSCLFDYHLYRFEKFGLQEDREHAMKCMELCFESLNYKKSFMDIISSRQFIANLFNGIYEKATLTLLEWYKSTGEINYLNRALAVAQKQNSFQLKQFLSERTSLKKLNVDENLVENYLAFQLQYDQSNLKLLKEFSEEELYANRQHEKAYQSIKEEIILKHPKFEELKNDFSTLTIEAIQAKLDDNTAIVKYFAGENNLISFVVTNQDVHYHIEEEIDHVDTLIGELRNQILNYSASNENKSVESKFMNTSLELYSKVMQQQVAALPDEISNLIILTSGSLKQIPFESFVTTPNKSWLDSEAFLINDFSIKYGYYLGQAVKQEMSKDLEKILTYGLEYDDFTLQSMKKNVGDSILFEIVNKFRSEEFSHTYFADDEALEIAKMFNGKSFLNEEATKESFLKNAPLFDLIHVSAHSYLDANSPEESSIILHKENERSNNLLRMKDILGVDLNGQFVVLSACNTFFGKDQKGEGLSSIAKSFIETGAGSVMGSYWPVPDEISKTFMSSFYSYLKDGLDKDEALRAAKLQFLNSDDLVSPMYKSPFYWSSWVIYGDTSPLELTSSFIYYVLGILIILIIVLLYFYTKKNL